MCGEGHSRGRVSDWIFDRAALLHHRSYFSPFQCGLHDAQGRESQELWASPLMEDIGIVLPDFLYLPLLVIFGALSVQQASQWLENFAELSRCPVWFHRDTFHPLSHWRLGLPVAHYLSCIVVLDHFGGVAQEGASGRYCLYPCMLILGHALPPREGDLLAKVLLYGNLCNRLLLMNHSLIVPCEQFGSTNSCADSTWFLCWGLQKWEGVFFQTGSLHSVVPDPKCAHRTCPFDSILLCESLLDGHAATLRKSTS